MRLAIGTIISTRGLLFDMDGTLIDSRIAVEHIWEAWCRRHGVDWHYVKSHLHGLRLRDSVRRFAPEGVDVVAETDFLYREELRNTDGIVPIPGAIELLASLPPESWTIVTSADKELARARLGAAGVGEPPLLVGGDDVHRGKPDPQGYIEGARRLGVEPGETLVFEDAAAGIEAGRAAGARVIAVATDHPEQIPDDIEWVPDLSALLFDGHDPVSGVIQLRVVA
ncbi:HAD-IA family hydrolase [Frateuria aurantia]